MKIPPFSNRGGFFALSLAAGGAGDAAAKPFGQVRVVPAPELGSANPSLQPKDGGGVLWIVGSNLRPEVESELVVVVASASSASSSSSSSSTDSVSSAVAARVVSSAIAAFESPAMPSGAASLTPSISGVAVPESAVAAAYLTRAVVAGANRRLRFRRAVLAARRFASRDPGSGIPGSRRAPLGPSPPSPPAWHPPGR